MFLETMKFTAKTLLRKPVRSLLTILQVSLGIAAIALVLNIIMQPDATADGLPFVGADEQLIQVYNGTEFEDESGVRTIGMTSIFTPEDIQAVRAIEGIVSIPLKRDDPRDTIELNGLVYQTSGLRSVNKDLMDLADLKVIEGTVFTSMDYENQSRTLVISQQAAKALFGDESPIGKKLAFTMSMPMGMAASTRTFNSSRFDGIREEFEVIGVVDISPGEGMPSNIRPEHFMAPLGEASAESADSQAEPGIGGAIIFAGPAAGMSVQAGPMAGGTSIQAGPMLSGLSIQAGPMTGSMEVLVAPLTDGTDSEAGPTTGDTGSQSEPLTGSTSPQPGPMTGGASPQPGPMTGGTSLQAGPMAGGASPQAGPMADGTSVQGGPMVFGTAPQAGPVTGGAGPQTGSVTSGTSAQTGPATSSTNVQTPRAWIRSSLFAEFTMVVKKSALDHVKRSMEEILAARHGSRLSLRFTEPYIPSTSGVDKTFGMFLGGFALVGLIVSSIGILSIMMVSVVERTREIGLRREIGASRSAVVFEIVTEAGLLAAAGAIIGLVAASFCAEPLARLMQTSSAVGPQEDLMRIGLAPAAVSVLISVAIGLLAGLYPAIQAARRPPVDALRELTP